MNANALKINAKFKFLILKCDFWLKKRLKTRLKFTINLQNNHALNKKLFNKMRYNA